MLNKSKKISSNILFNPFNKGEQICSPLLNGLNNILDDIFFDLFNITDMLLHNYVQHEKCLPSVTKNYEPEDGRLRPKHVGVF